MKKFFTVLFVIFGILFLVELIILAYIFIADPLGLRLEKSGNESVNSQAIDQNPLLNSSQEKILSGLGIDVANLPTEMTTDLQTCLTKAVGADRAQEIIDGATPGVMDIIKAKSCL